MTENNSRVRRKKVMSNKSQGLRHRGGNISPRRFTLGRAFHRPLKPLFSWFARVTARASCQALNLPKFGVHNHIEIEIFLYQFLHGYFRKIWAHPFNRPYCEIIKIMNTENSNKKLVATVLVIVVIVSCHFAKFSSHWTCGSSDARAKIF